MTGRLLFEVKDRFTIEGRGVVLVPDQFPNSQARKGDQLLIVRPDGNALTAEIASIETITDRGLSDSLAILIRMRDSLYGIPQGSQVYSISDER